jgi:hypothetical protein
MSEATMRSAGVLMIILPTVAFGGVSILRLWVGGSDYMKNPLRARMWAAGHAHAGVFLVLSLVALIYLDETTYSDGVRALVGWLIPGAAILVPAAFFFSTVAPDVEKPNALINLAYVGFVSLTAGLLILGVGLVDAAG